MEPEAVGNLAAHYESPTEFRINACKQNTSFIAADDTMLSDFLQNYTLSNYLMVNTINTDIAPKLEGIVDIM